MYEEAAKLMAQGQDVIHLEVGRPNFDTPQHIKDAAKKSLDAGNVHYGEFPGAFKLREAICNKLKSYNNLTPSPDEVLVTNGLTHAAYAVFTAAVDEGDEVILLEPYYPQHINKIELAGGKIVMAPLDKSNGFTIDRDTIESRITDKTLMIAMVNPANPTGRVFSRDELEALADLAKERNLLVVSDEVHCDLVLPGHHHIPYGSIGGERSVTVISPNKTFNTAGIPQATLIIPDAELRSSYQGYLDLTQLNHDSTFGAVGMIAGYRHCADWLGALIEYITVNHQFAADFLGGKVPKVRKIKAEATYLAWLDFRQTGLSQDEIMDRLVNIGGVGLYGGTEFGLQGEAFFRMNLGCPRSRLEQGLQGIQKAMAES